MSKEVRSEHYKPGEVHETWNCLEAWGLEKNALEWNVVKYIARAHKRPGEYLRDLKKALTYLTRRINQLEKQQAESWRVAEVEIKKVYAEARKLARKQRRRK